MLGSNTEFSYKSSFKPFLLSARQVNRREITLIALLFVIYLSGTKKATQIAKEQYGSMKNSLENVKLPKTRFLSIPLDSGFGKLPAHPDSVIRFLLMSEA